MGSLFSIGGLLIEDSKVEIFRNLLAHLCHQTGFPEEEEFKWSPKPKLWMYHNLVEEHRRKFFRSCFIAGKMMETTAFISIKDVGNGYRNAYSESLDLESDAYIMLLERAQKRCKTLNSDISHVVVDQPGGGPKQAKHLLESLNAIVQKGTEYFQPSARIQITCENSKNDRLVQFADLIVSCTTAYMGGENVYSPPLFPYLKPILYHSPFKVNRNYRIGGYGVKLHPSKYANIYHWLLGDEAASVFKNWSNLPTPSLPYYTPPILIRDLGKIDMI
jgi:hypothetical protein